MVITGRLHMARFHICVKNYHTFLNLSEKFKSALHGFTTGVITGAVISGAIGSRVSLLKREKPQLNPLRSSSAKN